MRIARWLTAPAGAIGASAFGRPTDDRDVPEQHGNDRPQLPRTDSKPEHIRVLKDGLGHHGKRWGSPTSVPEPIKRAKPAAVRPAGRVLHSALATPSPALCTVCGVPAGMSSVAPGPRRCSRPATTITSCPPRTSKCSSWTGCKCEGGGRPPGASGDVNLFASGCSQNLLIEGCHGRGRVLGGGQAVGVGETDRMPVP
jgi:hypothetical protein